MLNRPPTAWAILAAWAAMAALGVGCASTVAWLEGLPELSPMRGAPVSPARPWVPAAGEVDATAMPGELPVVPPEIERELRGEPEPGWESGAERRALPLSKLIDIGLRLSPDTRETWARARARAAAYGASRAPYYPALGAGFAFGHEKQQAHQGQLPYEETPYGPYLTLSFLLLDFGGRSATAEAARHALLAADWQHNQRLQDVILAVAQAYYLHVAAQAQLAAARADLEEAETSYAAADERFKAGVGILADALTTRAAAAQAKLVLVDRRGEVETTRGNLVTAMGLAANTPVEAAPPGHELDAGEASLGVDRLIEIARTQRPELRARRADVLEREAALRVAKSNTLPALSALGNLDHIYFTSNQTQGGQTVPGGERGGETSYIGALNLYYPLFQGFALTNAVRRAEADVAAAEAALSASDEQVVSQVWNAYYVFRTAVEKVKAAGELLASAQESYDVSSASYRAGVADIIELLTAQSLLARARAEDIRSNAELRISLARLLHDTGSLLAPEGAGAAPAASAPSSAAPSSVAP